MACQSESARTALWLVSLTRQLLCHSREARAGSGHRNEIPRAPGRKQLPIYLAGAWLQFLKGGHGFGRRREAQQHRFRTAGKRHWIVFVLFVAGPKTCIATRTNMEGILQTS